MHSQHLNHDSSVSHPCCLNFAFSIAYERRYTERPIVLPAGGGATEPDRLMALGVSAQLFEGVAAAIHLHATCNALASELPPLG